MHLSILVLAGLAFLRVGALEAGDSPPKHSTQEERKQIASEIHSLEANPLKPDTRQRRTALFAWLMKSPDVHLEWCAGLLIDAPKPDKDLVGDLLIQAILSAGAFVIENPEREGDALLVSRAGAHGARQSYRAILKNQPARASAFFDGLVAQEAAGTLNEYIKPKLPDCQ